MKVLYATDGLPPAVAAGELVKTLFARDGVEVTVATVTHSGSLDPDHVLLEIDPIEDRRRQSESRRYWREGRRKDFQRTHGVRHGANGIELLFASGIAVDVWVG